LYYWTGWNLKEVAGGAVGEKSQQETLRHEKMKPSAALEEEMVVRL
jgi:hypothetical protein